MFINVDGETSRDFCFINNCVEANLLAATVEREGAKNQVNNVACGTRTSLNELFQMIKEQVVETNKVAEGNTPEYRDVRVGDVRHSLADTSKAKDIFGYAVEFSVSDGMDQAAEWYLRDLV